MSSPAQFANIGGDLLTAWAQNMERMVTYASVFAARGGLSQFEKAKHVAVAPGVLTPEQVAENAELDRLGNLALEVVTHINQLSERYDTEKKVRVAKNRSDY